MHFYITHDYNELNYSFGDQRMYDLYKFIFCEEGKLWNIRDQKSDERFSTIFFKKICYHPNIYPYVLFLSSFLFSFF